MSKKKFFWLFIGIVLIYIIWWLEKYFSGKLVGYLKLTLTTPALLFPAISLLLLAYTNRFLVLAQLVRDLHAKYIKDPDQLLLGQIDNLRRRISIIKDMQFLGVSSFFFCVLCMLLIFFDKVFIAEITFGFSLLLLMASLWLSIQEIQISVDALNLHLCDLENEKQKCVQKMTESKFFSS